MTLLASRRGAIVLATLVALFASPCAFASGFSIFEQGAKASGLAGADAAWSDDASANWYNPAALVWLDDGSHLQIGANAITVGGSTEFEVNDPGFGVFQPTDFEPESSIETPVHLYYANKFHPNYAFGIGITTPFGLVTEWEERPVTFSAAKSELVTFVVNANAAFRMTENLALAVGIDWIHADVTEFSREVPIDLDGNPLNGFEVIGFSNLSGDGNELGFNAALSWRTDSQAFALTYRTGYEVDIDGTIEYDNFGPLAGAFIDSPGTTRLDLPAQATIAYGFTIGRSMKMEFDIAWAEWSAFEEIDVDIRDNTPFSQDFVIEENWDDTFSYRVGLTWEQSEQNEFRFGAVYDESPVPEEWLRPSIPDADRFGATVGWGYNNGGSWSLDSYYMALFFDDITAIPGNEGVVGGTYESFAHLAGVSVNFSF